MLSGRSRGSGRFDELSTKRLRIAATSVATRGAAVGAGGAAHGAFIVAVATVRADAAHAALQQLGGARTSVASGGGGRDAPL